MQHLAPYLPYNIEIRNVHHTTMKLENGFYLEKDMSNRFLLTGYSLENIKPILRPLSDLTKEIEVNGEKIFPVARLHYKSYRIRGTRARIEPTVSTYSRDQILSTKKFDSQLGIDIYLEQMNRNYYWINRQLCEWHFDIFGLIEDNLAIDINTL